MDVKIILLGKTNSRHLIEGEQKYDGRLKHYLKVKEVVIPELKKVKNLSQQQIKDKEGDLILKQLEPSDFVVLLDDKGQEYTSKAFAQWLQKRMNAGHKNLVFIVGGAYGFSDVVYQRANHKFSLSRLTFSHQMVRMIFKEQLYRACTILKGEPYHHD